MLMKPGFRKFVLTAHIVFSVGWLGSVAAFLVLAITGLSSQDTQTVRAVYIAMDLIGWFVIVPCSLLTFAIGLLQAFGTKWGLFRHYWVLIKFLLTLGANLLLLLHMQVAGRVALAVAETSFSMSDLRQLRIQLVADAVAALLVLVAATVLSVYKPWGLTRYGQRKQSKQNEISPATHPNSSTPWGLYILIGLAGLAVFFVIVHLAGGGLGQHAH